jgi:hypothetical protein
MSIPRPKFSEIYDIHGQGVARINLYRAVKNEQFRIACKKLSASMQAIVKSGRQRGR